MRTWLLFLCTATALPAVATGQVSADFPLGIGLRLPGYDRVDGVTLLYGPTVTVGDNRLVIDPRLTYRSQLGKIDPALAIAWHPDSALSLSVTGERGTFSNDGWIRSDLINSLYAFGLGVDARNYFRADRAESKLTLTLPTGSAPSSLYAGIRFENAWSTGWRVGERPAPYSVFDWHDTVNGMERPNPLINPGHLASALLGGESTYEDDRITTASSVLLEAAWHTPLANHFQQITVHDQTKLRTWADEKIELAIHFVTTPTGPAPAQRYAYVGGSGTLAMTNLLSLGGDHLYFVDALYDIPIPGAVLPLIGPLSIAPHFASGAANVGSFGAPTQNVGARLRGNVVVLDFLVNPRTHQHEFGAGLDFLH